MGLPADATLIVVGIGAGDERIEANLQELIAVWPREDLPLIDLRAAPSARACAPAWATFAGTAAGAAGGFEGTNLDGLLEEAGATTLVLCGALGAIETTARDAAALGYHAFIPFDACWPAKPFADPCFARLRRDGAAVIDTAATLAAAAMAKSRQRREAQRKR